MRHANRDTPFPRQAPLVCYRNTLDLVARHTRQAEQAMILSFTKVLHEDEHAAVLRLAQAGQFVDGKQTAGTDIAAIKRNQQLVPQSPQSSQIAEIVLAALRRHEAFRSATQPRQLHSLLVSRYQAGMAYGQHVDNALMGEPKAWRSDLSITLFLSDPDSYDGGELALESGSGEMLIKLPARDMVCYPTGQLHRVREVTRGVRLVVVAWIQSHVRDPRAREALWDLSQAMQDIVAREGKSRAYDLVSKTYSNLLRRWAEP